jgi:hypothetical protein
MRFINYLNEGVREDEINDLIQKDCKYYLNLTKGNIFTRGMTIGPRQFGKKEVRQDRIPKGMNQDTADNFNKWLKENGHLTRHNAVIAISPKDPSSISMYTEFGKNHWIFPIGKFSYTWIESKDVNISDKRTGWDDMVIDQLFNPRMTVTDDLLPKPFEQYFHTNKGIKVAYRNQYEIWFNCKEYYYVKIDKFWWDGKQLIELGGV